MPRFFIEKPLDDNVILIENEDFLHLTKSLRVKKDEKIVACDGKFEYNCIVVDILKDKVALNICNKLPVKTEPFIKVYVYISATKSDKLELVTQKCVELGVFEVIPFISKRSIIKLDDKSAQKKTERLNKIALEAAKQSGRAYVPKVKPFMSFSQMTEDVLTKDTRVVLYEKESDKPFKEIIAEKNYKSIAVIVGPEGGFEESEIEKIVSNNVFSVTLGKRILRAETAPIAALSAIMYENDELK